MSAATWCSYPGPKCYGLRVQVYLDTIRRCYQVERKDTMELLPVGSGSVAARGDALLDRSWFAKDLPWLPPCHRYPIPPWRVAPVFYKGSRSPPL